MARVLAILALAVVGGLLGVIFVSYGSDAASTSAAPPVVAPAIPCSSSGKKGASSTPTPTATTTPAATTWSGVFERVTAHLENDGSVKKTPRQFTRVSVEGSGPVTVDVPMSDKRLHRRDKGKKPSFSDGMAQVELDPAGTKTQEFDSDFTGSLPVAVKVSYELDGKPVSAHDVKHASGTVEVHYELDNTTAKPVTVCFKGFNGARTKQTVSTPHPIIAYLSFTVPSNVSTFHAHGAALAPSSKGVGASWTSSLFPPLGPAKQTFTFTMTTPKAEIPEAHLLLETLNPLSPSGALPQKSAVAVGQAAAAADRATAKVQSDIAALQVHSSQPKEPRRSSRARTSRSGARLSFGTPTSALTAMRSQITRLGDANLTFVGNVDRPARELLAATRAAMGRLAGGTRRSIDGSTTSVDRAVGQLNESIDRSLGGFSTSIGTSIATLHAELRRATAAPSLVAITARAARLRLASDTIKRHADAVAAGVAPVASEIDELMARLPAPVRASADLARHVARVKADLDVLHGADKTDPTFLRLLADVAAAQKVADDVHGELADLQQRAQTVAGDVHTLQSDVLSLQNEVTALEAAAVANAEGTIQGQLATAVAGLDARFATAKARAAHAVTAAELQAVASADRDEAKARRSVASAGAAGRRRVDSAERSARQSLRAAVRKARRSVLASERSVTDTLASVQDKAERALASAKQKAKQGGQASLAAAQSAAAQAATAVGNAVDDANADYARLLTTNAVATASRLPGGDAPGVTEQNGSFRYVIKGT